MVARQVGQKGRGHGAVWDAAREAARGENPNHPQNIKSKGRTVPIQADLKDIESDEETGGTKSDRIANFLVNERMHAAVKAEQSDSEQS